MQIHQFPPLAGEYALASTPVLEIDPASRVMAGLCRFGKGRRSPEAGMKASAATEIGYVVRGRLRIETASASHEAVAGDVLTSSPTEPHSTTALEDSEIFFVLLDPR